MGRKTSNKFFCGKGCLKGGANDHHTWGYKTIRLKEEVLGAVAHTIWLETEQHFWGCSQKNELVLLQMQCTMKHNALCMVSRRWYNNIKPGLPPGPPWCRPAS